MQHTGSLIVACGIWFPDQGLNLGPLHWECRVLATGSPGMSLLLLLFNKLTISGTSQFLRIIMAKKKKKGKERKKGKRKEEKQRKENNNQKSLTVLGPLSGRVEEEMFI